jgi:Fe-S-cluster containining protein
VSEPVKTKAGNVPCNGCTLCCRKWHMVALMPGHDDASQYETIQYGDVTMLAFQKNGDCVYLKDDKCSIHGRAPAVCREFDCRLVFMTTTRKQRKQMMKHGDESAEVYRAGRERMHTVDMTDPQVSWYLRQRGAFGEGMLRSSGKYSKRMARKINDER